MTLECGGAETAVVVSEGAPKIGFYSKPIPIH